MKRPEISRKMIVICCAMMMLSMAGCKGKDDKTSATSSETEASTTIGSSKEEDVVVHPTTESVTENTSKDSETEVEMSSSEKTVKHSEVKTSEGDDSKPSDKTPSSEGSSEDQPSLATSKETKPETGSGAEDELYAECEKYIKASIAFYNHLYGQDLKLIVFESQIEKTDTGYSFIVRSQAGKDANVYVAEVNVNTATDEMSDENGMSWKLGDYSEA